MVVAHGLAPNWRQGVCNHCNGPGRCVSAEPNVMIYNNGVCSVVSRLFHAPPVTLAIYTFSHTRRYVGSGTDLTHPPTPTPPPPTPGQNGRYFTENIFKCIFTNEKFFIRISLKFILKCTIHNKPGWLWVMAWCRTGSQPLPEPMLIPFPGPSSLAYICDTRRNDSARPLHK